MDKYMAKIKTALAATILMLLVAAHPAFSQQANSPVLINGFEGPTGVDSCTGLKCTISTSHVSEGSQAMSFTFPKYEQGANEWPSVFMDWNSGLGYTTKDWSPYSKLALDVWVDGDVQEDLFVELRNQKKHNGWSKDCVIMPGQKNSVEIEFSEIQGLDLHNIQEIAFFMPRPQHSYTITIDNIRLLPSDKEPVANFDLAYPNYRNIIFPGEHDIKVNTKISRAYGINPANITIKVTAVAQNMKITDERSLHGEEGTVTIPTAKFSAGEVKLSAELADKTNGQTISKQAWTLRKITKKEVDSLKTYIDEYNNTIVDGKPFFPLGWYNDTTNKYLDEMANTPFNCLLDYGTNNMSKAEMEKYLDKMQQMGLKLVYCLNDVYPTATYFKNKSWEGITGNDNIVSSVVDTYKNHPAVIAWYLNDELPKTLEPKLADYYHRVAAADPTRPCFIVLCDMPQVKYFPNTTDIMGVDLYPVPSSPLTIVSDEAEIAKSAVHGHKPIWVIPQAFAWYQYNSSDPNRGHIPTAAELKAGRAPTYEEDRCMTYLALTHGAKGLIYYCYYDMRLLPQYKEMWGWMKKIGEEVKALSPMLLSNEDLGTVKYVSQSKNIHTKLKRYNGKLYLMAVNAGDISCTVKFDCAKQLSGRAVVMFEDRTVTTSGATITDAFKPMEVHVYNLGTSAQ